MTTATAAGPRHRTLLARVLPAGLYAGRPLVLMERSLRVTKSSWIIVLSGFFEPLFYLLSFGIGIGGLVGDVTGPGGRPIAYAAFIAPALLATSAMNGAIYDSTNNVFFKLKHLKLYDSMLATPLGPLDVALGEMGWALSRGGLYAASFTIVMLVMGLLTSWWAALLMPACVLIAFGFAAVGMGITTFMKSWQDLDLVNLAIMPMFLFSGTFFSLDVYPEPVQWLVRALPLHHGVELLRGLAVGFVDLSMAGHVAYFVVMSLIGIWVTVRRLDRLLMR
ncbi:ABC transporter permease [Cumulibacter manganitolerans]|uniref:ABC transporter permease n=1 Tax=Cumulibacter manganitolerans TaxID=1884992 RepID=UPI001E357730|nr:ABC transporter permease [Cumulibacter manganitolerans]